MKKKYIQPNVSVSFVVVESLLQTKSGGGLNKEQNPEGGTCAKKHDFFSWEVDEEDESESNSSSKSLWED